MVQRSIVPTEARLSPDSECLIAQTMSDLPSMQVDGLGGKEKTAAPSLLKTHLWAPSQFQPHPIESHSANRAHSIAAGEHIRGNRPCVNAGGEWTVGGSDSECSMSKGGRGSSSKDD